MHVKSRYQVEHSGASYIFAALLLAIVRFVPLVIGLTWLQDDNKPKKPLGEDDQPGGVYGPQGGPALRQQVCTLGA